MSARKVAVAPGFGGAIWLDRSQKWSRRRRASGLPPARRPAATSTAFTAPTLAPLTASNVRSASSSRRSSTPQAKAPREPPPWRARERRLVPPRAGFASKPWGSVFRPAGRLRSSALWLGVGEVMVCLLVAIGSHAEEPQRAVTDGPVGAVGQVTCRGL